MHGMLAPELQGGGYSFNIKVDRRSMILTYLTYCRNGGHISPLVYNEYSDLKQVHGSLGAQEILRFRLAHISSLIAVAKEENLLSASQARVVEGFDAFMHPEMFGKAKRDLQAFLRDVARDLQKGFGVIDERETLKVGDLPRNFLSIVLNTKLEIPTGSLHSWVNRQTWCLRTCIPLGHWDPFKSFVSVYQVRMHYETFSFCEYHSNQIPQLSIIY